MCDERTEGENDGWLSRREVVGGLAAASWGFAAPAAAADVTEAEVMVTTAAGTMDAVFCHPAGRSPAVLVWPDILGVRASMRGIARRLAGQGYAALVVNPYYRQVRAPVAPEGSTFRDPAIRDRVLPLKQALTSAMARSDGRAAIDWLDASPAVDPKKGAGVMGYCMGGPMSFWTAAERADRVRALASFHGGGLVTDAADSPHLGIPSLAAAALVAVAANDDAAEPTVKDALRAAFAAAGKDAEIEVYAGTQHGWCPPDSVVYDPPSAERAWERLSALLAKALV